MIRKLTEFLTTYYKDKFFILSIIILVAFFSQFLLGKDNAFEQIGEFLLKEKIKIMFDFLGIKIDKELIQQIDFSN